MSVPTNVSKKANVSFFVIKLLLERVNLKGGEAWWCSIWILYAMCDESPLAELRAEDRGRSIRAGCYARGWRGRKGGGAGEGGHSLSSHPQIPPTLLRYSAITSAHTTCHMRRVQTSEIMQEQNGEVRPGHSTKQVQFSLHFHKVFLK